MALGKPIIFIIEDKQLKKLASQVSDLGGFSTVLYELDNLDVLCNRLRGPIRDIVNKIKTNQPVNVNVVSWQDIASGVIKAVELISNMWVALDLVVGVGRGGAIIGAMIAGNLGHENFYVFNRAYPGTKGRGKPLILDQGNVDLNEKNILVVFSEIRTGDTFKEAMKILKKKKPKDIRTLTLFKSTLAKDVEVDYCIYPSTYTGISIQQPWYLTSVYQPHRKYTN